MVLALSVILLTTFGCGKSAPECSDEQNIKLVKEKTYSILEKRYSKSYLQYIDISVDNIVTKKVNKETHNRKCSCDITIGNVGEDRYTFSTLFYSEITEDSGDVLVSFEKFDYESFRQEMAKYNAEAKDYLDDVTICAGVYWIEHEGNYSGLTFDILYEEYGLSKRLDIYTTMEFTESSILVECYHLKGDIQYSYAFTYSHESGEWEEESYQKFR